MRKKSKELLDMALRELHTAINEGKEEVELVLREDFTGDQKKIQEFSDKYELKKVTEKLREEFANYELKSVICAEPNFMAFVCFEKGPCKKVANRSLRWKLSLRAKN